MEGQVGLCGWSKRSNLIRREEWSDNVEQEEEISKISKFTSSSDE